MTLLCIDESGNTQGVIALGLVAIQDKAIDAISQLFTVRPNDPPEILALYARDPESNKRKEGELPKPRNELKYSDFLNAEKATNLPTYREFIKQKLEKSATMPIQVFCSLFDNPIENLERRKRLNLEARTILHMWQLHNFNDSLSQNLRIVVDTQVFSSKMIFQVYERRNKWHCEIFPSQMGGGIVHYGGRSSHTIIEEKNSRNFKPLQFADFIVGAIREAKTRDRQDMLERIRPLMTRENIRDARGTYSPYNKLKIRM